MTVKNKALREIERRAFAETVNEQLNNGRAVIRDGKEVLDIVELGECHCDVGGRTILITFGKPTKFVTVHGRVTDIDYLDRENNWVMTFFIVPPSTNVSLTHIAFHQDPIFG